MEVHEGKSPEPEKPSGLGACHDLMEEHIASSLRKLAKEGRGEGDPLREDILSLKALVKVAREFREKESLTDRSTEVLVNANRQAAQREMEIARQRSQIEVLAAVVGRDREGTRAAIQRQLDDLHKSGPPETREEAERLVREVNVELQRQGFLLRREPPTSCSRQGLLSLMTHRHMRLGFVFSVGGNGGTAGIPKVTVVDPFPSN